MKELVENSLDAEASSIGLSFDNCQIIKKKTNLIAFPECRGSFQKQWPRGNRGARQWSGHIQGEL